MMTMVIIWYEYSHIPSPQVLGYWGDIVASPYFSFGVDCETPNKYAEGLYEILNKVYHYA